MNANFVLVAQGSVTHPVINHMIFSKEAKAAAIDARMVVGKLALAGYFIFTLYDVQNPEAQKQVATFRAEQPEPVVTTTLFGQEA